MASLFEEGEARATRVIAEAALVRGCTDFGDAGKWLGRRDCSRRGRFAGCEAPCEHEDLAGLTFCKMNVHTGYGNEGFVGGGSAECLEGVEVF